MKIGLFIALALVIICSLCMYAGASEKAKEAKFIYIYGDVKISNDNKTTWIAATKDMVVRDKDIIKTAELAKAEVSLDSTLRNVISIQPGTEVVFQDLSKNKIHMPNGSVLALIEALPAGSSFEVRTPTAVAGVAGSGIFVNTDGQNTQAGCFEDKGFVQGIDKDGNPMPDKLEIEEGYKRDVGMFENPSDPIELDALEKQMWSDFKENLDEHAGGQGGDPASGEGNTQEGLVNQQEDAQESWEDNKEDVFEERENQKRDDATKAPDTTPSGGGGGFEY